MRLLLRLLLTRGIGDGEVAIVQPTTDARRAVFHCADGYVEASPLADLDAADAILVYSTNQTSDNRLGYPLRLAITGKYGYKWPKWIQRIEIAPTTVSATGRSGAYPTGQNSETAGRETPRLPTPREPRWLAQPRSGGHRGHAGNSGSRLPGRSAGSETWHPSRTTPHTVSRCRQPGC